MTPPTHPLVRWFLRPQPPAGEWRLRGVGSRARGRAKRAVLAGVAVVAVLVLGMNVVLDTARPEWHDPEIWHRIKQLRGETAATGSHARPLVVALGSSRSQMGFNPARMGFDDDPAGPRIYNLSQAGCGPVHEVVNLKRLLDAGATPDYLLVEILPPVLAGNGPVEKVFAPEKLGAADLPRVLPYCEHPRDLLAAWLAARVNPWYSLRISLMSHWGAGSTMPWQWRTDFLWKQMKEHGWMPYFFTEIPPGQRKEGIDKASGQYVPYFADFRIAPLPDRAYRDLLALCRARGIPVAFYVMPESPTFRGWYPPAARERIRSYYRELGVPVFDASDWIGDETMFADGHHLMRHGATAFSERFGRECVGPWIRNGGR
ncbi:hypothetical protein FRUB_02571 [Fimbriiglobus ruber]|uniref:Uncharacterized protein n=2 Tax=Fimbriiglobus ruber TaxID=1908690 RepID=A0A225DNL0_9BACT|nr:hypothetical protein FRUB_02571 [Fimbriiglobus ruber]